ncbi:hypothetical protein [Paraphotobacterium marinum]|nr:hypothetical protein [Paraphotobacterium marinum]
MKFIKNIFFLMVFFGFPIAAKNIPEIYIFNGGDSICQNLKKINYKFISGVQVIYKWRDLEPRKGHYNFKSINKDITCLKKIHKKLFIQLQDRTFNINNIPAPDYILEKKYDYGIQKQTDNAGKNLKGVGWVTKQWNPNVNKRYSLLVEKLGSTFNNNFYVAGINLPETAIDVEITHPNFCKQYFETTLKNLSLIKKSFPSKQIIQYVNFFPCEWDNDHNYMNRLFKYAIANKIGLGNPDTAPFKNSQMKNSYPFFHKNKNLVFPIGVAVQSPDYTYINPKTHRKYTIKELYNYSKNYLGSDIIFWDAQEPQYTKKVVPFLKSLSQH